jgi:hypothetical protein
MLVGSLRHDSFGSPDGVLAFSLVPLYAAVLKGDSAMTAKPENRVALVAGGTGGLGRAVSLASLESGYTVVVTYRRPEEWEALQSAAGANLPRLEGYSLDVTDEAAVAGLISNLVGKHGRLDALINTVGGYAGGARLWESDPKVFDLMLALNLRSGFVLCRAAVPVMLKQGGGVDRQRRFESSIRSCRRGGRLCGFQIGGDCHDRFAGCRFEGHRSAGQLHRSQHHRHRSQSESDAWLGLREVAEVGRHRARHPVLVW